MEYISSDTNVWIDFSIIKRTELPFRLPYTYVMEEEAIDVELLYPAGLRDDLLRFGLVGVEMEYEEFEYAETLGSRYNRLTAYDRIALAIAKKRNITLLTGDGALRKAAAAEGVTVMGTIGIVDLLYSGGFIDIAEYRYCLEEMQTHNGQEIRLPKDEITSRLRKLG